MKIRIPRKLKKRYKKMGIWKSYLSLRPYYVYDWQDIMTVAAGIEDSSVDLD